VYSDTQHEQYPTKWAANWTKENIFSHLVRAAIFVTTAKGCEIAPISKSVSARFARRTYEGLWREGVFQMENMTMKFKNVDVMAVMQYNVNNVTRKNGNFTLYVSTEQVLFILMYGAGGDDL
jgi:hypothetical protein